MLEELCRALSTATKADSGEKKEGAVASAEGSKEEVSAFEAKEECVRLVCEFWEKLLGGGLASYLSAPAATSSEYNSSLTSQACNVLATMGAQAMAALKVSMYTLQHTHITFAIISFSLDSISNPCSDTSAWYLPR